MKLNDIDNVLNYTNENSNKNVVFTRPDIVKKHLRFALGQYKGNINSKTTFCDNAFKSGSYLTSITKLLMKNSDEIKKYPNSHDRMQHILDDQLYGGYVANFNRTIFLNLLYPYAHSNFLSLKELKSHLCKANDVKKLESFKPDITVSNPPYTRMQTGKSKKHTTYKAIFPIFANSSYKFSQMISSEALPNRWFTGGNGLNKFLKNVLNNQHLRSIFIFNNSSDLFPSTKIRGGVSFLLFDKKYNNHNQITVYHNSIHNKSIQPLKVDGIRIFISSPLALKVISHIHTDLSKHKMINHISSSCPFGVRPSFTSSPNFKKYKKLGLLKCYGKRHKIGYVSLSDIKNSKYFGKSDNTYLDSLKHYNVFLSHGNNVGIKGSNKINTIVAKPHEVCTETYIIIGYDLNLNAVSANNLVKYLNTDFVKYLISICKYSQLGNKSVFQAVPLQNFNDNNKTINWKASISSINSQLFKYYHLGKDVQTKVHQNLVASLN